MLHSSFLIVTFPLSSPKGINSYTTRGIIYDRGVRHFSATTPTLLRLQGEKMTEEIDYHGIDRSHKIKMSC